MHLVNLSIVFLLLNAWSGLDYWSSAAITIWLWYVIRLFEQSNKRIAFKEFILVLYGLNYLFSPALSYLLNKSSFYRMKLPEDEYFMLAIPCILLLQVGMNTVKTNVFKFDFSTVSHQSSLNRDILVSWIYAGLALRLFYFIVPDELAFFLYLVSGVRFAAAYGLYVLDARRYKWHIISILAVEIAMSLKDGMFHDTVMWLIFFGIFWVYVTKPSRNLKLLLGLGLCLAVYILQVTKAEYRSQIGKGEEAGLSAFQDAVSENVNAKEGLFDAEKTTNSLTRVNQAWILASAANRMNRFQDFQGLTLVGRYAEAAFLPRFLAKDKLMAGDKQIFNRFSGHFINNGTSMGLGVLADGYVAYGHMGAYGFTFVLGLIFAMIFRTVEKWSRISPFFILFMFPILNYAVRPDCETQVIMGHIVKGLFVFGCLSMYYASYFSKKQQQAKLEQEKRTNHVTRLRKISVRRAT